MGMEVNKISNTPSSYRRLSNAATTGAPDAMELRVEHGPETGDDDGSGTTGELSGIYFGILNIYQTIPQFIGTFISTVVFAVLEPGKSPELAHDANPAKTDGPNAIAVCLFIGAGAAVVAAVATRRLKAIK